MTLTEECDHLWTDDPMFADGTVVMLTNDQHPFGEEMRQYCKKCGKVRYIPK